MCGIVGYIGARDCADVLVDALTNLEYRGYDSAGIAVFEEGAIRVAKSKGRLADLSAKLAAEGKPAGHIGVGHTRWATHGEPSDRNAHPHGSAKVTLVHNGIIENYKPLKAELLDAGVQFLSDTDTEVVARLLEQVYDGDPVGAILAVMKRLEGSFALGVMFGDQPDRLYAVRRESPLIVGVTADERFIASDVTAILKYTRQYYLPENDEIAILTAGDVTFYNTDREVVEKELKVADWDMNAAEKGGYDHFMLKEIYEQPTAVKTTIAPRITNGL
ncbi:MAG: class II glutamine amidotransferase, partial [Clostridia bacterium]|nr:class II glutamine amidotransferase [Clostridia bacterium]